MKKSIGLLEFKSIAKGIEATDAMLKSANIELILSTPVCPGKYVTVISGEVGAVKNAVEAGKIVGSTFTIEAYVIPNINENVFPALTGTICFDNVASIGIIETISAISSIIAGDIAVKSANVKLMEIRVARGLGGKGFVMMTGEVAAVKASITTCEDRMKDEGSIISSVVIASPSKELISTLI